MQEILRAGAPVGRQWRQQGNERKHQEVREVRILDGPLGSPYNRLVYLPVRGSVSHPMPSTTDPWRRNLWSIVAAEVIVLVAFHTSFVFIPYYLQELGLRDLRQVAAWTGAYQSAGAIGFAIFTPIWGAMGDRYGRKLMLMRAMVATTLALIFMGMARTPTQLMLLRIIQGCTTGTPAAGSALVAVSAPRNRVAYGLGLIQTALFVGNSLGPLLGGFVADAYGYRATFFASAVMSLSATLLVLALVTEPSVTDSSPGRAPRLGALSSFAELLRNRRVVFLTALTIAITTVYGLLGPVLPLLIQELVTHPDRLASTAGTVSGVAAFTAAVAAMVVGRLSGRLGYRRALLGCSLGMTLMYLPQAVVRSVTALALWRGLQGLFQGGISPCTSAMVVDGVPSERTGAALGLNSSASSLGYAVGPVLGALTLAATSTRGAILVAAAGFAAITAAVATLRRPGDASRA